MAAPRSLLFDGDNTGSICSSLPDLASKFEREVWKACEHAKLDWCGRVACCDIARKRGEQLSEIFIH